MTKTLLLAAAVLAAVPAAAYAQSGNSPIVRDRVDQAPARAPARAAAPSTPAAASPRAAPPAIAPFTVTRVIVEGSTLPAAQIDAATAPFVGQTLDSNGVNRAADAVAAVYDKGPLALYTVLAPEQDFAGGVLRLRAVEGYIVSARIDGDIKGRDMSLARAYIAKITAERPLTRKTLQRYVALMNDISEFNPQVKFTPQPTLGQVQLDITANPKTFRFGVAVNNRGTALLGRTQVQAEASASSILRQGDNTRLTVAFPTDFGRFQYYSVAHSTPLGTDGAMLSGNLGYLRTRPKGFDLRGHAWQGGINASYPWLRRLDRSGYVGIGVDGINADNALFGQQLSEDRVRTARAFASFAKESTKDFFVINGAASAGLGDALGARTLDTFGTELDFKKANGRVGYDRRVAKHVVMRLVAAGQVSGDRLPSSEQFALGGSDFGRAYAAALISGDKAIAGSAELALRPVSGLPQKLSGSELYGFVDGGKVRYRGRYGFPGQTLELGSFGGGGRLNLMGKTELQVEAARAMGNKLAFLDTKETRVIVSVRTLF